MWRLYLPVPYHWSAYANIIIKIIITTTKQPDGLSHSPVSSCCDSSASLMARYLARWSTTDNQWEKKAQQPHMHDKNDD